MRLVDRFDAFLLDLDGVVWRGEEAIEWADEAIAGLRKQNKQVVFVTNNASRSARDYAAKLMRMHIPTEPKDVISSGHAVAAYLTENLARGARIHVFGTDALRQVVSLAGFEPTSDVEGVEGLVVAFNTRATFDDLARAADVARTGLPFIGANRDATYPVAGGLVPGSGSLIAAVEVASGRDATIVGKPAPYLFELALERAGVQRDRALFIGDRADSDVVGSRRVGLPVALVLTGVTQRRDVKRLDDAGDVVMDDLRGLFSNRPAPAERDDQQHPRDEAADVREIGDAAALRRVAGDDAPTDQL